MRWEILSHPGEPLRREAVRSISLGPDPRGAEVLRRVAADPQFSPSLRAEAVLGLADTSSTSQATRDLLLKLLKDEPALRLDAVHALRPAVGNARVRDALLSGSPGEAVWMALRFDARARSDARFPPLKQFDKERPKTVAEWKPVLSQPGDAAAGARVFFNPNGPKCYACHRVNGRGGALGPDLTRIAQDRNLDKLIESILEPNKEIAPQFEGWLFQLQNGDVVTARIWEETGDRYRITTLEKRSSVRKADLLAHQRYRSSMMPSGLESALTRRQFRDLIAFLSTRR